MENNIDMKKVIEDRLTHAEQEQTFLHAKLESIDTEIELYNTLLNLYEETETTLGIKNPVPVIEHKFPKGDYKEKVVEYFDKEEHVKVIGNDEKPLTAPIEELAKKINIPAQTTDKMPKNTQNKSIYTYDIIRILESSMRPVKASEVAARMHTKVGCIHKALIMMAHQGLINRNMYKEYSLPKKEVK